MCNWFEVHIAMSENKWPGKPVEGGRKDLINTRKREGVREEDSEERGKVLAGHSLFVTHREIERL